MTDCERQTGKPVQEVKNERGGQQGGLEERRIREMRLRSEEGRRGRGEEMKEARRLVLGAEAVR